MLVQISDSGSSLRGASCKKMEAGHWRRAWVRCRAVVSSGPGTVTRIVLACCSMVAWLSAGTSDAVARPGATWEKHTESVLELLMQDTRRALEHYESRRTGSRPEVKPADRTPARAMADRIELIELYGHGDTLTAVLAVNGQRKEYRPGATLPYGGQGSRNEYRLVRIVDTCVVLRKGSGPLRTACYQPRMHYGTVRPGTAVRGRSADGPLSAPLPGLN